MRDNPYLSAVTQLRTLTPNRWDIVAIPLIFGVVFALIFGIRQMAAPVAVLQSAPISLDPSNLPEYALRTVLRMLAALIASLVFTFVYGTLAGKSRRLAMVLIPLLDVLQSVPVLGYL
ncbi:MAG TPA: sulfonate ABC transporter permease, partial [Alphaproteobacteria bacterium]|nr:sulfonate ABC transporter permease [Alphaproteobacteria bacterium]